jgi:hypothetical protein
MLHLCSNHEIKWLANNRLVGTPGATLLFERNIYPPAPHSRPVRVPERKFQVQTEGQKVLLHVLHGLHGKTLMRFQQLRYKGVPGSRKSAAVKKVRNERNEAKLFGRLSANSLTVSSSKAATIQTACQVRRPGILSRCANLALQRTRSSVFLSR